VTYDCRCRLWSCWVGMLCASYLFTMLQVLVWCVGLCLHVRNNATCLVYGGSAGGLNACAFSPVAKGEHAGGIGHNL
jgi:hypothetical protein